jgi:hypothetical protein
MDILAAARVVLREAEEHLRELLAEAAKNGRYEDLAVMASWAQQVAMICEENRASSELSPVGAHGIDDGTPMMDDEAPTRFHREGETLVKTTRSRRNGTDYEHRAPKEVLVSLLAGLSRGSARKKPISVETLTPLHTRHNVPIPNYQVYLALAYLKSCGVVEQRGRQGYILTSVTDVTALAEELWQRLPTVEALAS